MIRRASALVNLASGFDNCLRFSAVIPFTEPYQIVPKVIPSPPPRLFRIVHLRGIPQERRLSEVQQFNLVSYPALLPSARHMRLVSIRISQLFTIMNQSLKRLSKMIAVKGEFWKVWSLDRHRLTGEGSEVPARAKVLPLRMPRTKRWQRSPMRPSPLHARLARHLGPRLPTCLCPAAKLELPARPVVLVNRLSRCLCMPCRPPYSTLRAAPVPVAVEFRRRPRQFPRFHHLL